MTVNVEPFPGSLSTWISPPRRRAISRLIDRPSPVPPYLRLVVPSACWKASKITSSFSVVDNGLTIQVNVAPGNALTIMGRRYELQQFHFHRPSEERINGRQYDMVAHLVHKDADGRQATVAVLLERGQDQTLIQTVWNYLPLERGDTYAAPVPIDLTQLLPRDQAYFSYMGSMTTPPCTEGVLWLVLRQPVQVSSQQISVFSHLYPMNARPLQAQSGRLIKESN